eukprot:m.512717 g.512717  ORF g.512717 m.512717 type:complete len:138 (-) comp21897_c1_seq10:1119-1532(-)
MGDTTRLYIVDGHNNFASPSSGDSGNDACASDAPALPMNRVTRVRVVMNATRVAVYYNDTLVCTEPRNDRSIFMGASVYVGDPWYPPARAMVSNLYISNIAAVKPIDTVELSVAVSALNASISASLASQLNTSVRHT